MGRLKKDNPDRPAECPLCGHNDIIGNGKDANGRQRWRCKASSCGLSWSLESMAKIPKNYTYYLQWAEEQKKKQPRSQRQLAIAIGISPVQLSMAIKKYKTRT